MVVYEIKVKTICQNMRNWEVQKVGFYRMNGSGEKIIWISWKDTKMFNGNAMMIQDIDRAIQYVLSVIEAYCQFQLPGLK